MDVKIDQKLTREQQVDTLKKGEIFIKLLKPAVIGDGILNLSKTEVEKFIDCFKSNAHNYSQESFIPASGAATRMFKEIASGNQKATDIFITNLHNFPFFQQIEEELEHQGISLKTLCTNEVIDFVLYEKGLNFAHTPKAFIPFFNSQEKGITPIEEHIKDNISFQSSEKVKVHFTIPKTHIQEFDNLIKTLKVFYEKNTGKQIEITSSVQNEQTNTICLDEKNEVVKVTAPNGVKEDFKRPAGHGALLENLQSLNSDLVFINNIDNISFNHFKPDIYTYKMALAGLLMDTVNQIHSIIDLLESQDIEYTELLKTNQHLFSRLDIKIPDSIENDKAKTRTFLLNELNKPIRVCGMVKNEGQPGGGPFWVHDKNGKISKQIVEAVHVNKNDVHQKAALETATHFNPVNMVCYMKDKKGSKFNLGQFIDPDTCIITWKSIDGKKIKALEYPGLWNGSMANWLTIFVNIPSTTFHPVKTVFDLLQNNPSR